MKLKSLSIWTFIEIEGRDRAKDQGERAKKK
jgi:hypothetical protein